MTKVYRLKRPLNQLALLSSGLTFLICIIMLGFRILNGYTSLRSEYLDIVMSMSLFGIIVFTLILSTMILNRQLTIHNHIDQLDDARLKSERELRDALYYNRNLIETTLDPMVIINKQGIITDANKAATDIRGISIDQLIGSLLFDYFTEPERAKEAFQQVLTIGFLKNFQLTFKHSSGKLKDVLYNAAVYKSSEGEVMGVIAVARDITEKNLAEANLKKNYAALEQRNLELRQFSYITSHDLQEPLRMISSFLQLLETRYKGKLGKDADDFIHFAVDGARRLQNMINDLMIYSRIDSRGEPPQPIDSKICLSSAIENLYSDIMHTGAVIGFDELPVIMADKRQITILFTNLLSNAIKFRRNEVKPVIHVSSRYTDNMWIFSVKDNGMGIPAQYINNVFVVFKRLVSRAYPGTGTGLAICKKIVERHNGEIWVESQEGHGSTFYFSLPAQPLESALSVTPGETINKFG